MYVHSWLSWDVIMMVLDADVCVCRVSVYVWVGWGVCEWEGVCVNGVRGVLVGWVWGWQELSLWAIIMLYVSAVFETFGLDTRGGLPTWKKCIEINEALSENSEITKECPVISRGCTFRGKCIIFFTPIWHILMWHMTWLSHSSELWLGLFWFFTKFLTIIGDLTVDLLLRLFIMISKMFWIQVGAFPLQF